MFAIDLCVTSPTIANVDYAKKYCSWLSHACCRVYKINASISNQSLLFLIPHYMITSIIVFYRWEFHEIHWRSCSVPTTNQSTWLLCQGFHSNRHSAFSSNTSRITWGMLMHLSADSAKQLSEYLFRLYIHDNEDCMANVG